MNGQNTDPVLISKLLDSADDLIVAGIAVCFTANLTDLLHSVNDDEIGVGMFPHEVFKLFVQPVSDLARRSCKVQPVDVVDAVHHEHPALDSLEQGTEPYPDGLHSPTAFALC